ncbi:MAG: hypothetical protein MRJ96_00820 [Nitrospirales bacterium]|nr:SGNH/GDSL hydrolase family protein [Nitrospira sp.]MDR4499983.1 hypothetical protein [Nitrospirales bacterium]
MKTFTRETPSRVNRFERYPKTILALVMVGLTLIADFVLTGIYHIQKYGTIHKYAERRALRESSPVFHHTLKANGEQREQKWGNLSSPFYTNSLGFKDKRVGQVQLKTDNYRILFIGDSFTEGIGIAYEKTFVGIVDHALSLDKIEVLNAGVSSYSPTIYFKKVECLLETVGLDFDHLVVFLDISDIEDEVKRYDMQDGRVVGLESQTSRLKEFVYEYTGLLKNIWTVVVKIQTALDPTHEDLRTETERRYGINQQKSLWTVDERLFREYGERGLEKVRRMMERLYRLLQDHQIGMTLAVYPWPDQIVHNDLYSRQVIVWQAWARERSVNFLNLFPLFISRDGEAKQVIERYFIEGDVHWNEDGHRVVAQALLRNMQSVLPTLSKGKRGKVEKD